MYRLLFISLFVLLPLSNGKGCWRNIDASITGSPRKRHEAGFIMVRGKGYLLGGRGANGFGLDIFDPKTRTWKRGAQLPTQMHHFQPCSFHAKIYIISSWFGNFPREQNNAKIWIYNTKTNKWSSRDGLPPNRRRGGGACVRYKKNLCVVAGNRGGHGAQSTSLGWMDCYNVKTNKWNSNYPNMPDPRDHTGGALVNRQLCVAGGRNSGVANFFGAVKRSTWCYDFKKRQWINKNATFPVGRAGSSYGQTCEGKLMVVGGEAAQKLAFNRVDVFDGKKWETPAFLQRGRHGSGLAVARSCTCGQIFIASGSGNQGGAPELESTELYDPGCEPARRCVQY